MSYNKGKLDKGKLLQIQFVWTNEGVQLKGNVPARVSQCEAAEMLGLSKSDMCALHQSKLLYPCGQKPKRGRQYYNTAFYCTQALVRCMCDEEWWHDAQEAISCYNAKKNGRGQRVKDG